jgi:ribokinase
MTEGGPVSAEADQLYDAVGLGALNVDRVFRVRKIDRRSDDERVATDLTRTPGGSAANTIFALSRLGLRTTCIGAIGVDSGGAMLKDNLSHGGVDVQHILEKRGSTTGEAICIADQQSNRDITIWPGANGQLKPGDISRLSSKIRPRLFHFTSFVDDSQLQGQIEMARSLDSETILSFSPGTLYAKRPFGDIEELAKRCHVLFANSSELGLLMGSTLDYVTAARLFLDKSDRCKTVVVTLGSGDRASKKGGETRQSLFQLAAAPMGDGQRQSCVVVQRDRVISVRYANFTRAADPTGAGDALAAGFLFGLLSNEPLERCALLGHSVAQFSVAGIGARSHLPTHSEMLSAVDSNLAEAVEI